MTNEEQTLTQLNDESNDKEMPLPSPSFAGNFASDIIVYETRKVKGQEGQFSTHAYRLGKFLGKGGSSLVYQCTAMDNEKEYAIKIVSNRYLSKSKARFSSLQREIAIHHKLKNKHICKFIHAFQDTSNLYILLELCPNGTLYDLIRNRKRLSESEAAGIMLDLLDAVQYLHEHGIIHGDLKPHNIYLDSNMRIKVGDFGLSQQLSSRNDKSKRFCGTPNFVAPEVLQRRQARAYSLQVDIWAMGVILYHMLVGKAPFQGSTIRSTYKRIRCNAYVFPDHAPLSPQVCNLISSMLQVNPDERATLDMIRQHRFFHIGPKIPFYVVPIVSHVDPKLIRPKRSKTKSSSGQKKHHHHQQQQQQQLAIVPISSTNNNMMDPIELTSGKCLCQEGFVA